MTWTYSGNPSASDNDEVRFLVGDTETTDQLVQDEEIAYAVAEESNNRYAASRIARSIAAKFSRKVDKNIGDLKISYSRRYQQYLDMADELKADASTFGVIPYAGGITISDKESVEKNPDRVSPSFSKNMHDNPSSRTDDEEKYI